MTAEDGGHNGELATWGELNLPVMGMDPDKRLRLLTEPTVEIPVRQISAGEDVDPFGLLDHHDTYEVFATQIFRQCEGVYKTLANNNPEVIRQLGKKPEQQIGDLIFPVSQLGDLYAFRMRRSGSIDQVSYDFQRADPGYEDKGFRVVHTKENHFVLRNLEQGDTDLEDNDEYYKLLQSAQKWIADYAASLNIRPENLLALAGNELRPHRLRAKLGRIVAQGAAEAVDGVSVASQKLTHMSLAAASRNNIGRVAKALLTKPYYEHAWRDRLIWLEKPDPVAGKLKPRWLGVMAVASLIPTSLQPTIVGQSVVAGVGVVAGDIFNTQAHARESYDEQDLELPSKAAELVITSNIEQVSIPYVTTISSNLAKAPDWGSNSADDNGNLVDGSIRHLDGLSVQYENSTGQATLYGLEPGGCDDVSANEAYSADLPGGTVLKVLNTDKFVSGLALRAVSNEFMVCNIGKTGIVSQGLDGVYVQAFYPRDKLDSKLA